MKTVVETIVAAATPPGRGGVAIIRISGPLVLTLTQSLINKTLQPRFATFARFLDSSQAPIDEGIALFFPGPNSFTGEDILELHGHGGPAVVDCLIRRILSLGCRLARPGEFSERAFLNDKIDLVQAEAIADLIDAASEQAARNAVRSLQGDFSKKIRALVEDLIQLRIYVEAAIDFVEEEIDFLNGKQVSNGLSEILSNLLILERSATQGSLIRDGITVVIAGKPNVGKSSLLNQLSGKDTAIVTDIPGTTRDLLRADIIIDGMPLHIIDTAGLRDTEDKIEQIGIHRAHEEIANADLVIFMTDVTVQDEWLVSDFLKEILSSATVITVRNKIDLANEEPSIKHEADHTIISLSAKNNLGLDLLKTHIKNSVGYNIHPEGNFSARRRHLDALARAKGFLLNGEYQLKEHRAGELLAEDLRMAQNALNEITGEFSSDDLLGRIFGSFCIGK
jgi:tRNA modification GTPase